MILLTFFGLHYLHYDIWYYDVLYAFFVQHVFREKTHISYLSLTTFLVNIKKPVRPCRASEVSLHSGRVTCLAGTSTH